MTDAIGHELKPGDFVTAVWMNAEVSLFEIIEFTGPRVGPYSNSWADRSCSRIKLARLGESRETNQNPNKPVYKTSEQVTWVNPDSARNYILLYHLEQ
jgi:hypothetical protein